MVNKIISFFKNFIFRRLKKGNSSYEDIKPGKGSIIDKGGKKVAVYKDEHGNIKKLSPVCTHLGCIVDWDEDNNQWSCGCHGSSFSIDGDVIKGPAKKPLKEV